jgi:hypothetical protein
MWRSRSRVRGQLSGTKQAHKTELVAGLDTGVIDNGAHANQCSAQKGDQRRHSARLASRLDPVVHEQQPVIGPNRQRADAERQAATPPVRVFGDLLDSTRMDRIGFARKYQANTECVRRQRSQHESPGLDRNNARHCLVFERLNKRRTNVLHERSGTKNSREIGMRVGPSELREKGFTSSRSRSGHDPSVPNPTELVRHLERRLRAGPRLSGSTRTVRHAESRPHAREARRTAAHL